MIDVAVSGLVKSFEIGSNILDGLSFQVEAGERVGILGPNGCGKTTLFRLIAGELRPDEGEIAIAPGRRLGLISQIPVYPEGWTVEDVLRDAHRRLYALQRRMDELTERMEHVDQLGYFIDNLCRGKDTFKLQRRDRILGMQKREALNCRKIRHFENKFVVETLICEP